MPYLQEDFDLKKRKLRVLFITDNKGFCKFYRVKWPAIYLQRECECECKTTSPEFMDEVVELGEWADVLVFQLGALSEYIVKYSEFILNNKIPQLIVMDFDDDYFHIHPTNMLGYRTMGQKEFGGIWKDGEDGFDLKANKKRLELFTKAIIASDIITVTTPELGKIYKQLNPNIVVLPNLLNPDAMPINDKPKDDRIIIGYHGGDSHFADIKYIMPTLEKVKQKYGDLVHFKFMGTNFPKLFKNIKAEIIPWTRPENFYDIFSRQKIDIAVIPLLYTIFNQGKSNIKWLENSFYKIPCVVSGVPPYKQHIKHLKNGYVYSDYNQLFIFLCDLINDPMQRKMLGGLANIEVMENWTLKGNAHLWYDAYKYAILKKIDCMNNLQ